MIPPQGTPRGCHWGRGSHPPVVRRIRTAELDSWLPYKEKPQPSGSRSQRYADALALVGLGKESHHRHPYTGVRARGVDGCALPKDTHCRHSPSGLVPRVCAASRIPSSGPGPDDPTTGLADEEEGNEGGAVVGSRGTTDVLALGGVSLGQNPRRGGCPSAVCSCCGGQGSSRRGTGAEGGQGDRHGASARGGRRASRGCQGGRNMVDTAAVGEGGSMPY